MAENDTAAVLRLIARDLEQVVLPNVATENAQSLVGMMKVLLEREAHKVDQFTSFADMPTHRAHDGDDWATLIANVERAQAAALAGEEVSREAAWAQSGSGRGQKGGSAARAAPISADQLTFYLRDRRDGAWIEDLMIRQTPGGFSKDTFIVAAQGGDRSQNFVIRRDQTYRPLVTSVRDEAPVLTMLSARGFPAPTPLWVEADESIFGTAAMAVTAAKGSADTTLWAGDPDRLARIVQNSADLLATLHAVPLSELPTKGSGVPGSNGDSPAAFVEDLDRFWRTIGDGTNLLVERVLRWLADNAPSSFGRTALIHGDYGLHNQMVDGDSITAVLDWEFWHVGDPREDLAYIRPFMTTIGAWPMFVEAYVAAGGTPPDPDVERFYAILSTLRVAMGCYALRHAFAHGEAAIDSKMIYVGRSFADNFLIEAAKLASADA